MNTITNVKVIYSENKIMAENEGVTFTNIQEFENLCLSVAQHVFFGYDKTAVVVTLSNGDQHEMRLDLCTTELCLKQHIELLSHGKYSIEGYDQIEMNTSAIDYDYFKRAGEKALAKQIKEDDERREAKIKNEYMETLAKGEALGLVEAECNTKQGAKNIRLWLKNNVKGVKFSVTSKAYYGITVANKTDITKEQIELIRSFWEMYSLMTKTFAGDYRVNFNF